MRFKSSIDKSSLSASLAIHFVFACIALSPLAWRTFLARQEPTRVDFEVIDHPQLTPSALNLKQPSTQPAPKAQAHKVFGLNKNSIVDANGSGPAVQAGNTLATEPKNDKLLPNDADSLPIPTDEYLITRMPKLKTDVRIAYPPDARAKGIAGPVVLDLLIDEKGLVREVTLVTGPDASLNDAAMRAAREFRFTPAEVETKTVAVRIRYTYRFVLEH